MENHIKHECNLMCRYSYTFIKFFMESLIAIRGIANYGHIKDDTSSYDVSHGHIIHGLFFPDQSLIMWPMIILFLQFN